ncbi:MAG TPA: DUF3943 domain-containing protein [Polyangia bacterium]|nr:DUF3943 domain-containing protein [Polyangia bacterium]
MNLLGVLLTLVAMQLPPVAPAVDSPEVPAAPFRVVPVDDPAVPRPSLPYLRTIVETSFVLGLGTVWYWRAPSASDFDLHFDKRDWRSKLFSVNDVVFDDNRFSTNGIVHPVAGAIYYQIARGNGLGPGASFASSFLASAVWEYFTEFREKPSINDLILTPMGGAVIGEATYRVGRMFAAGRPSIPNCIGAMVFSLVATLNETTVCRSASHPPYDGVGFSQSTPHRLDLAVGESFGRFDDGPLSGDLLIDFATVVVTNPGYDRPGQETLPVHAGQWTSFILEGLLSDGDLTGFWMHADMVWWGRYSRHFAEPSGERGDKPHGHGLMLALESTFDYDTRDLPMEKDRTATAGILGPRMEYTSRRGHVTWRADVGAAYGFSIVTSLVYPFAAPALAGQEIKSELWQQGYYYAQSLTAHAAFQARVGSVELSLAARLLDAWSFNRGDRYQSQITNNFSLFDQRTWVRAAVTLPVFGGPLNALLMAERDDRSSRIPGFSVHSVETRGALSILARF